MSQKVSSRKPIAPDKVPLTESQAAVLSSLTGIEASKFKGQTIEAISSEFRWQIDPNLLLFTRICGKVVKQDPATGNQYPVPFATVYAEETVCSLFGYFPIGLPWAWFFPFHCHTTQVAETTTDACGNFCVWVPRFIIEWIRRFRIERVCFLKLFKKPNIGDIIAYLQGPHIPDPDPGPESVANVVLNPGTPIYQKAEQLLGTQVVRQLAATGATRSLGSVNTSQQELLARPAFPTALPPSLPKEFRKQTGISAKEHMTAVRSTMANNLGINAKQIEDLNLDHYYGPFLRCIDLIVPEWVPILEVPDISFRVTQDVNGTGTQEVIYPGGLFEVSWAGSVYNVTLLASPIAISTPICNTPNVPCGNVPSLEYAGLMPLVNPAAPAAPYIDATAGYALRPNPPHPGGTIAEAGVPPSIAPYAGTLQLYGCTMVDNAAFYRLRFTYTAPGTTTASASTPFTGVSWPLYREVGGILQEQWPAADANGWYPIINPADDWFPNSMVFEWNTALFADGLYSIVLEVANGSKTAIAASDPVGFMIDNSAPKVSYTAKWSFNSDLSNSHDILTNDCVVIRRGATPKDVYVQVAYSVTSNHLRSVKVGSSESCDSGATLTSDPSTAEHWYEGPGSDTGVSNTATYKILSSQLEGVYNFDVYAVSCAFNPDGHDGGHLADWNYNTDYVWTHPFFGVAIVNSD